MMKLSEIMTRNVITVTPETTLRDTVEIFATRHISGLPVINGREIVGVISAADVISFAASMPEPPDEPTEPPELRFYRDNLGESDGGDVQAYFSQLFCDEASDVVERMAEPRAAEWDLLDHHVVDEVMTRKPIALSPDDLVSTAAELMYRLSIHRVVIVDDGGIVGIVSALDVARVVGQGQIVN